MKIRLIVYVVEQCVRYDHVRVNRLSTMFTTVVKAERTSKPLGIFETPHLRYETDAPRTQCLILGPPME